MIELDRNEKSWINDTIVPVLGCISAAACYGRLSRQQPVEHEAMLQAIRLYLLEEFKHQ